MKLFTFSINMFRARVNTDLIFKVQLHKWKLLHLIWENKFSKQIAPAVFSSMASLHPICLEDPQGRGPQKGSFPRERHPDQGRSLLLGGGLRPCSSQP